SYYTKIHRKPRLMSKNLQDSSHSLKAVGFRLLQLEGFIFMKKGMQTKTKKKLAHRKLFTIYRAICNLEKPDIPRLIV
ncbi:MAG: hypothetical protein ACI37J_07850, partial [Candidatus Bruticola sp.]